MRGQNARLYRGKLKRPGCACSITFAGKFSPCFFHGKNPGGEKQSLCYLRYALRAHEAWTRYYESVRG